MRARVLLVLLLTAVAYHHSLRVLAGALGGETPLAYVGLVPLLALGVALVRGRPRPGESRLPHRQADWIVGLPLLAVAALVALVLPDRLSYEYWTNRVDLVGLPFFVAGLVAILLGGRVLYRVRLPVAALALAWPLPHERGLDGLLAVAADGTVTAVRAVAPLLGVGRATAGTLFVVGDGAARFTVNVAPQCAGASSTLGFLLVGGAIVCVLGGRRPAKLWWLLTGLAVQALLNVVRILGVFAVGDRYGERATVDWLHPYLGMVLFTASTAVLVALLPRFGVPLRVPPAAADTPPVPHPPRLPVLGAAVACALALGLVNADLRRFEPYADTTAASPYRPLTARIAPVAGWTGWPAGTIEWARPYFGASSAWHRLAYRSPAGRALFVDAVDTDDLGAFSRYGLEACYRFHDYDIVTSSRADVGAPSPARTLVYRADAAGSWAVVSWVLPVGGGRFERVAVMGRYDGTRAGAAEARAELLAFSRLLVRAQQASPA